MSALPVIAVFDVGKTNKKLFLFNEQYQIVYERSHQFDETTDEDGDACEDLTQLTHWGRTSFAALNDLKDFEIRALNFSAYGASFVHIDANGKAQLPLYNYLKPLSPELKAEFFNKYGGEECMAMETASPVLGSLNSGLQLYRLKKQNKFTGEGFSLHLPQYLSFLITGKLYSDITSIGCHTMLWHFQQNNYHKWVEQEQLQSRLAPIFSSTEVIHSRAHWKEFEVGVGLHDSSAALIPYLTGFHQPFILISTGTWCISLNPFNDSPLTPAQLSKDCLCYLSYAGRPVKASRLFAGYEHEQQVKRLAEHFHKQKHYFETVSFNSDFSDAVPDNDTRPVILSASGFEHRDLNDFPSDEAAYHQLMSDIMRQQVFSTRLVMEGDPVKRIFVDGGFGKNAVYMNLLARSFPSVEVYAASVPQATAMGAALAIHRHWNPQELPADLIALKYYPGHTAVDGRAGTVKKR